MLHDTRSRPLPPSSDIPPPPSSPGADLTVKSSPSRPCSPHSLLQHAPQSYSSNTSTWTPAAPSSSQMFVPPATSNPINFYDPQIGYKDYELDNEHLDSYEPEPLEPFPEELEDNYAEYNSSWYPPSQALLTNEPSSFASGSSYHFPPPPQHQPPPLSIQPLPSSQHQPPPPSLQPPFSFQYQLLSSSQHQPPQPLSFQPSQYQPTVLSHPPASSHPDFQAGSSSQPHLEKRRGERQSERGGYVHCVIMGMGEPHNLTAEFCEKNPPARLPSMSISSDNVGLDHRNPSPATRKGKCRRVDHSKVTRIPVDILEDIKTDFSLYMLKTDVMPEEHDTVAEAVVDKILSQQTFLDQEAQRPPQTT
ncbi:hypothetical protein SERLADRAFT_444103 [Serpula lacrymans var. lacrymans S7.9]|uniref:Uncharacterized protein n=1 Tax=Serpula lacrymans var. lacrymans (strain S7.9) TaxID=578457 RepID=F8PEI1_SERL9|nr:uncharacterized protein SERLADRAFT_444103 [Serpula lacrymans var. lacrymans S7.9]EGO18432.1 hypothetical protein SERLADRAFT_444103 [Serpula lacrymans var. lacrymans S7.9]